MNDGSCHSHCSGCCGGVSRRRFIGCGGAAVATLGGLSSLAREAATPPDAPIRVGAVFLSNIRIREIWPYPGYDTKARREEVLKALRNGCPGIEFVPFVAENKEDARRLAAEGNKLDGYLVFVMTLDWRQGQVIANIGKRKKPMLVVDDVLGGSGTFLTRYSALRRQGVRAAAVSSTRLDDVVEVARAFGELRNPDVTPAAFARRCETLYRQRCPAAGASKCIDDPVALTDIGTCVERFRKSRFLIVGRGKPGTERDYLGSKGRYVDFSELKALYDKVDPVQAAEWAERWTGRATKLVAGDYVEPSQPAPEAIRKAGGVYLATLKLLQKHGTDTVTMNCLGGFSSGKLPAYPCLGFMQLLNDGAQGVCEAMPDDSIGMLMARILTGRPGFVSDPALDTSKNQVVYAHCVGTTKVFGTKGDANGYRIRTLHNRDPQGACSESLMPGGYMTTSFRTNAGRKELVIHQARAVGTLDSERGCRTKLLGEVRGDIEKLFYQWDRFGWHRVTVYGDVKEPLMEFGKALGLKVIEEA